MTNPESTRQQLIDKIVKDPLHFTDEEFNRLVSDETALNFQDLRQIITRIFDINETTLRQQSDATKGLMGYLNARSTRKRQKAYYQQIDRGFRGGEHRDNKVIVAEGDSWFQFPFLIKDIIDWLRTEPRYAVYSIAYGGDWFTNILYEEKYIEELSIHRPDAFLISGGGNDFVGSNRLAIMVRPEAGSGLPPNTGMRYRLLESEPAHTRNDILAAYPHITPAFFSFIWTIKAQYWILFHNLQRCGKYGHMKIITQGYDYAIPTLARRRNYFMQSLVNRLVGSGRWLKRPMLIKGLTDEYQCEQILKAMIFELNCMFIELASDKAFPNVYHIDCRNTARGWNDWYDELHLVGKRYREIALAYKRCIDGDGKEKIIRVNEMAVRPGVTTMIQPAKKEEPVLKRRELEEEK